MMIYSPEQLDEYGAIFGPSAEEVRQTEEIAAYQDCMAELEAAGAGVARGL